MALSRQLRSVALALRNSGIPEPDRRAAAHALIDPLNVSDKDRDDFVRLAYDVNFPAD